MQDESTGSRQEWLVPFAFAVCAGWATWHTPAYLLDFIPHVDESMRSQITELHLRKDILPNLPGITGYADIVDLLVLILMPVIFVYGVLTVRCAHMEYQQWRPIDRIAIFVGRITMILIIAMTSIMLYEVFLRYVFEAPTLWANELSLWLAGYIFLFSGFYAMQQRCHIRIFILYDMTPRWAQHCFDIISVALLWIFSFFLVYGSFKQVFIVKFYQWEMFGTAFDPPIPATVQPMILIIIPLIALQAAINLISDWNQEPTEHTGADPLDEEELEAIKRAVGEN